MPTQEAQVLQSIANLAEPRGSTLKSIAQPLDHLSQDQVKKALHRLLGKERVRKNKGGTRWRLDAAFVRRTRAAAVRKAKAQEKAQKAKKAAAAAVRRKVLAGKRRSKNTLEARRRRTRAQLSGYARAIYTSLAEQTGWTAKGVSAQKLRGLTRRRLGMVPVRAAYARALHRLVESSCLKQDGNEYALV